MSQISLNNGDLLLLISMHCQNSLVIVTEGDIKSSPLIEAKCTWSSDQFASQLKIIVSTKDIRTDFSSKLCASNKRNYPVKAQKKSNPTNKLC